MNLGEMRETLARDVLGRDDVNEALTIAIKYAHREIQRIKNWRAMEARVTGLTIPADDVTGIVVSANYKKGRQLYVVNGVALESIMPSTEEEVNILRRISQNTRNQAPTAAGYIQRWYEVGLRIALFIPPTSDTDVVVDIYQYLDFYADENADDYFSIFMPEALIQCAAYYMSENVNDPRTKDFFMRFQQLTEASFASDVEAKQGGNYRVRKGPPVPAQAGS